MEIGNKVKILPPADESGWNRSMLKKVGAEGIVAGLKDGKARVRFAGTGRMTRRIVNYGIRRDEFFVFPEGCLELTGHCDAWACPAPR